MDRTAMDRTATGPPATEGATGTRRTLIEGPLASVILVGDAFRRTTAIQGPDTRAQAACREYLRGTLVLDIIDVRTEEVIFRGWARKSLNSDPSPEQVPDVCH